MRPMRKSTRASRHHRPRARVPAMDALVSPASCRISAINGNSPNRHPAFDHRPRQNNIWRGDRRRSRGNFQNAAHIELLRRTAANRCDCVRASHATAKTRQRLTPPAINTPRQPNRSPMKPAIISTDQVAHHRARRARGEIATRRSASAKRSDTSASMIGIRPPPADAADDTQPSSDCGKLIAMLQTNVVTTRMERQMKHDAGAPEHVAERAENQVGPARRAACRRRTAAPPSRAGRRATAQSAG